MARRPALEPFDPPQDRQSLCKLCTPTTFLFPNTFLIWHPDYVSLIGMVLSQCGVQSNTVCSIRRKA